MTTMSAAAASWLSCDSGAIPVPAVRETLVKQGTERCEAFFDGLADGSVPDQQHVLAVEGVPAGMAP